MNWPRGLRRITLLASIACAPWAGFYTYQRLAPVVTDMEKAQVTLRKLTFDDTSEPGVKLAEMLNFGLLPEDDPHRKAGSDPNEQNWQKAHNQRIYQFEAHIQTFKLRLVAKTSLAGASGFAAPWVIYGLLIWIGLGFVEGW